MSDRGDFQMLGQCRSSQQDSPRLEYIYIDPRSTTPDSLAKNASPMECLGYLQSEGHPQPRKDAFSFPIVKQKSFLGSKGTA